MTHCQHCNRVRDHAFWCPENNYSGATPPSIAEMMREDYPDEFNDEQLEDLEHLNMMAAAIWFLGEMEEWTHERD